MAGEASSTGYPGEAIGLAPPRERSITMPEGIPELTLGWGAIEWITDNLVHPNGPRAGKPFRLVKSQVLFVLWFYAIDENGRWLHNRAVRRLAKGSGKSPFAAVLALLELLGPVRVKNFDPDAPGGVVGMPVSMPLVQVAATSEDQTANTMRMVRAMSHKGTKLAKKYGLEVGKTYVETPDGGKLSQITSSASAAEGAELTFAVADETEHWTPAKGGPDLAETLDQNLTKTGSRLVETCNAWIPGIGSVAESTFDSWCQEQEGLTIATQGILYDARVAPPNAVLDDEPDREKGEISLTEALRFVYDDCWWVDIEPIKQKIWSPTYPVSRSRRFFLNQPNSTEDAWVTLQEWSVLADPGKVVDEEEEIVLFFDGSKTRDATALVGCRMSDGHVFTLGVWQPTPGDPVDTGAVDSAVIHAFEKYNVIAFFADVREWESFVKVSWPDQFRDDLILWAVPKGKEPQAIAWDMRSHSYQFAENAEMCLAEIQDGAFTHDGNWDTSRHIGNCRRAEFRGRGTVRKESKDSPNKIDAAVCVIGARMVRRLVLASPEWERRSTHNKWVVLG
jgi:hypothetical protein